MADNHRRRGVRPTPPPLLSSNSKAARGADRQGRPPQRRGAAARLPPRGGGGGLLSLAWASLGKCSHRQGGAPNPPQPHLHLQARMGERTGLGRVAPQRIPHRTEAQVLPSRRDMQGGGRGG